MSNLVKIALVSDIHAAIPDEKGIAASYASTAPTDGTDKDALLSLEKLIKDGGLNANFIFCCGDMTNMSNASAMRYVWGKFQDLGSQLGAKPYATVGNHDVDSRHKHNDHDARGMLRGLTPSYPLGSIPLNYEFWSRNFVIIEEPGIRLVVLNSCAYHGVNPDPAAPEYYHGRISEYTLGDLREALSTTTETDNSTPRPYKVNILLCHHHPHKHQDIETVDYSNMKGGEKLIDLLQDVGTDTWIVLHGHKHQPRLIYGAGAGRAPLVFGAGSLSAKLHGDLQGRARNQFYMITLDLDAAHSLELDIAGTLEAWDYQLGKGWVPAKANSGLPARSGFGYRPSIRADASSLANQVKTSGGILKWSEATKATPKLSYLLPADLDSIATELKSRHGIAGQKDEYGAYISFAEVMP